MFGAVLIIALLFWSAAIYMHRRKSIGRTLALIASPITMFAFWPVGIYAWWFMDSYDGKALYGIDDDFKDKIPYQSNISKPADP